MNTLKILSLPKMRFAHIYKSEHYRNVIPTSENFIEITYISEGSMNVSVGDESFFVQKGDVVCLFHDKEITISAPTSHCHHTTGANVKCKLSNDELNDFYIPTVTRASDGTDEICHIIDEIIYRQTAYKSSDAKYAYKILELLCEIDRCNKKSKSFEMFGDTVYTRRAKKYIDENIHSPITQKEIAEYLGISPGYLCLVFKKNVGITLMKYINKTKLESLKNLMDNEGIYLYEAVALYGYSDPNYVSRLFKSIFGYNITDKPNLHPVIE